MVLLQSAAAKGLLYCPIAKVFATGDESALDCSTAVSRPDGCIANLQLSQTGPAAVSHPRSNSRPDDSFWRTAKVALDSREGGNLSHTGCLGEAESG
jgi:hypothetical protein